MEATNFTGTLIVLMILYGIPLGFVLTDPLISKIERVIWVIATIWGSWITCILFLWIAPVLPKPSKTLEELPRQTPRIDDRY